MLRRLVLFNLLLVTVIAGGVVKLRRNFTSFSAEHQVSRIQPASEKPLPKAAEVLVPRAKGEWTDIATRNPFSFDRNDVALVVTPPTQTGAPVKRPKPVLFGTMMLGADRLAMMAVGDGPARSSRPVRVGEILDGWTLVKIEDKSVLIRWDETEEPLLMSDPTAQAARDYAKTNGPAASAPVVTVSATSAFPAGQPMQAGPNPINPGQPGSTSGRRQILVHTPFGDKMMDDPAQQ
jgi:hypothetical protein